MGLFSLKIFNRKLNSNLLVIKQTYLSLKEAMEEVWKRSFEEMYMKPEEHPVLMTHYPLGNKKQKEKIVEVLMEKFNFPATYLAIPSLLSVYASGRACGSSSFSVVIRFIQLYKILSLRFLLHSVFLCCIQLFLITTHN